MDQSGNTPKISVLLPVYNTKEPYLREAVDSILVQTLADFELIIVNDASTDANVEKVVQTYTDPRIRYYRNAENTGISRTRNRLIELARGEYLAVMDHDDVSLPQRFEKEAAYLDAHPEVGVVSCHVELFQGKTGFERMPAEDAEIRLALVTVCALVHPASMIRKSVLIETNIRYEDAFSPAEDYALWCRLIPHTKFHNVPEVLFRYRFHDLNTSSVQSERILRAGLAVRCFVKADYPALYALFMETRTHITKVKLFGFLPFLKIVAKGNRRTCFLFGIPLFRSKTYSEFKK